MTKEADKEFYNHLFNFRVFTGNKIYNLTPEEGLEEQKKSPPPPPPIVNEWEKPDYDPNQAMDEYYEQYPNERSR